MNRREFLKLAGGAIMTMSVGAHAGVGAPTGNSRSIGCPPLDFAWAKRRWADPLTGVEVVCLSPPEKLHFRNPYFRIPMFAGDGQYCVLWGYPQPRGDESAIWSVDMRTGATRVFPYGKERRVGGLLSWATSYHSHLMHVIVRTPDGLAIERVDLDGGARHTMAPSPPLPFIYDATASAGDQYIYTPVSHKVVPEGTGASERVALMGAEPGRNVMHRIDLTTGEVTALFETDRWWMGHPNPNPCDPQLLMCCQEGFNWTERYPRPADFSRVRLYRLDRREWTLFPQLQAVGPAHEIWSASGQRIWTHGWPSVYQCISVTDAATAETDSYVVRNGAGDSAHIHPAPDESFAVGDGTDFGKNNQAVIEEMVKSRAVDDPWAWAGYGSDSPGEVIWKYELPPKSFFTPRPEGWSEQQLAQAIDDHPDQVVGTVLVCQFRSMARLLTKPMRNESNAHVTPDSRWAVFQSASEDGLYEVWAARVPGV